MGETLLETGMCSSCYRAWLDMEFSTRSKKRIHEATDAEWYQMETAELQGGDEEM